MDLTRRGGRREEGYRDLILIQAHGLTLAGRRFRSMTLAKQPAWLTRLHTHRQEGIPSPSVEIVHGEGAETLLNGRRSRASFPAEQTFLKRAEVGPCSSTHALQWLNPSEHCPACICAHGLQFQGICEPRVQGPLAKLRTATVCIWARQTPSS